MTGRKNKTQNLRPKKEQKDEGSMSSARKKEKAAWGRGGRRRIQHQKLRTHPKRENGVVAGEGRGE